MDFQKIVDGMAAMTCVISVEKLENGGYGKIRIVTGNKSYIDSIEHPAGNYSMLTNKFIPNSEYTEYLTRDLNFEEYCFVAKNAAGEIIGAITGRAYYNEVHIGDLIIDKNYRRKNIGSKLVRAVEEAYKGKGYRKITLTTFGFQAPDFYKKLGYSLEFVRKDEDPKLCKYFYCKMI